MSLILPVLILFMGGLAEFGMALQQKHVADKGVKNAARYLARVVNLDGACPPTNTNWNTLVGNAKTLAQKGTLNGNAAYLLTNWTSASDVTVSVSCIDNTSGNYRGFDQIPVINVSTTFNFNDIGMLSLLNIQSLSISASHEQMFIGG